MTQTNLHHGSTVQPAAAASTTYVLVPPPDFVLVPLTGAVVILAGILIGAFFASRVKRAAGVQAQEILNSNAALADQLTQLGTGLAVMDARLATLAGRLDEQSRSSQGSAPTSYSVAIRMARSGASRQELMSTCGVTQQEADLVLRLHSADSTMRTAA